MAIAVYPGSFDPVTCGHLDIIERAAQIFEGLNVTVFSNPNKKHLFSPQERMDMLREATKPFNNVTIDSYTGLLTQYTREKDIKIVVKGLRAVSDFLYEFQMALTNKKLEPELETLLIISSAQYSYLSSSIVKELAYFDGCLKGLVPPYVENKLINKIKGTR